MEKIFKIIQYEDRHEQEWDKFIADDAINGTFLQSRNFLNYHPKERFLDNSCLIFKGDSIAAIVPGCVIIDDAGKKEFSSHAGSTFGGFVIHKDKFHIQAVMDIVETFTQYIKRNGFDNVLLKITSDLFSTKKTDLLQYALQYNGYEQYTELSAYMDLSLCEDDITANFNELKRRQIKKCLKYPLVFRQLICDKDIAEFYDLLSKNLLKFNTNPVHTLEELYDFHNIRLRDIVHFYGVYYENHLVAGCMCFVFGATKAIHTQYLCSLQNEFDFVPMPFLYYELINHVRGRGYRFLSLGISTENQGRQLNLGLAQSKEAVGCAFTLNRVFRLKL